MNFIDQIKKNLETNGFPNKRVSFDLEKLYEIADKKDENLNDILESLSEEGFLHTKESDKIIFFKERPESLDSNEMYAKAQEAMKNMTPEEMDKIKHMAENMSDEEKQEMMAQAKKMGLL